MKSVNELIAFLRTCVSSEKHGRRSMVKTTNRLGATETVEARLLLTANLEGSKSTIVQGGGDVSVDSYLVAFNNAQNTNQLRAATGASSVVASAFVENAYTLEFDNVLTLQAATDSFAPLPGFQYLYPNIGYIPVAEATPNDPLYTNQWHLQNTGQGGGLAGIDANVEGAWDSVTGQGVTIGIVDTGLETDHPDLVGNINTTVDFDWVDGDQDPSPAAGENHGTAVAGVASAAGNNGIGVSGAAWDAEIAGLRLLGNSPITDQDIAESQTHQSQIIDIYNNSWGPGDRTAIQAFGSGPQTTAALQNGAENGRGGRGVIRVNSSGNGGPGSNSNYFRVTNSRFTIPVGALGNTGVLASYSTPGAATILVAPSGGGTLGITTADRVGAEGYDATDYTDTFSGTSSAAPLVAGVVALMLEANPELTYRDVVDILVHSSDQVDANAASWSINGAGLPVSHDYGFGNVDAAEAVSMARTHVRLAPEETFSTGLQAANLFIPDLATVSQTYTVTTADEIESLEWVEVVFNATHTFIGDLEITLTSPDGTQSVLAEPRLTDPGTSYSNWVFTTIHHYDESSLGNWTLSVRDGQALDTGTLDSFELRFFGTNPDEGAIIRETGQGTTVTDSGQTDTIDVVLAEQPASNVVINIVSNDTGEVTVSDASLTFTSQNWDVVQTVTVAGVFDLAADGDQQTDVVFSIDAANSDPEVRGIADTVISVTSIDDDEFLPHKPVVTGPAGILAVGSSPTFTWIPGANTDSVSLVVTNRLTGLVTRQVSGLFGNSHVFAGSLPNGVYETTVQGFNSLGQAGVISDPVIFAIGTPAIPSTPSITSPTSGQIVTTATPQFVWTPVQDALSYELLATSGTSTFRQVVPASTTGNPTHTFATAFAEGPGTVSVRAFNAFDQPGDWSEPVQFTVDAFLQPQQPTIIRPAVAVTSNAFPEFRWIAPGGSKYELWVGRVPDANGAGTASSVNNRVIRVTDHNATSYTHFIALRNSSYVAWVRSFNAAGEASPWSRGVSFEVDVPEPSRPAVVTYVENLGTNPTIGWASTGEDFPIGTTFHLWVNNLSTGQARVVQERELTTTTYSFTDGLPQGRYGVWVQATSSVGAKSAWSQRFDFNIDIAAPGRPNLTGPAPLTGDVDVKSDFPVFTWDAVPDATTFDLWVNAVSGRVSQIIRVKDIPAGTSYTHDQGLPEGTYKAWLRAANRDGEVGEWSRPLEFSLDVPGPAKPTITGPVPASGGAVETSTPTITWTTLGGASTYNLQFEVVRTGESLADVTGLTEQQFAITDTLTEQAYRVRVQGVNSVGEIGPWSDFYVFTVDVPNATTPVAFLPQGTVTESQVTFQWQHTASSVRYEVLVRDLLRQESIVFQVSTRELDQTGDRAVYTASLNDGTYRYWVRAFNTQGTASGWSNSRSFTVDTVASVTQEPDSRLEIALASLTSAEQLAADVSGAQQLPTETEVSEERATSTQGVETQADVEAVMAEFADPASQAFSQES